MSLPCRTLVLIACLAGGGTARGADATADIQFNRDIRPLLSENCFQCHGPDAGTREAELRLDTQAGLFGKTTSGANVVAPGDLEHSELYARINSADDTRMPPLDSGKKLSPAQVDLIRRWIEQGGQWQGHWAYLPPQRVEPPTIPGDDWSQGAVDQFIRARLVAANLQPSPPADEITLIRRLSFDLLGLPPSSADVAAFLSDDSPRAYETLVDRLLDSPHYGERMAQHWLDLVRYADSGGYHSDTEHSISPYRDYVIGAFNANLPFDQFTREQLAGDLLPSPTREMRIATGYNRLNKTTEEGGAQAGEYLVKYAADRVRTTAGAWMGITLGCAECHDHKYDPFTTKDFYSFVAIFADVQEQGVYGGGRRPPELHVPTPEQEAELGRLDAQLAELKPALEPGGFLLPEAATVIEQRVADLAAAREKLEQQLTRTMITVSVEPREIRILPRGNWLDHSGDVVEAATPASLPAPQKTGDKLTRLEFANWLVAPENPLTARVFVNRLWKQLFGTGLSKQLDDLGAQGEWPTHPELLDWLAVEFRDSGWDVKHLIRLLVTSSTYRQSSLASEALRKIDPFNRLYARQSRWRIDGESVRDNALVVSGLLVPTIGGPSVKPYQPAGYWSHLNFPTREWVSDTGPAQYRRGLYTHWQRTFLHPSLLAFDAPSREECTAERPISNTPKAALTLLNDPTYVEAARVFAVRILREGGGDEHAQIRWAWRTALSREANPQEVEPLADLLDSQRAAYQQDPASARDALAVGQAPVPEDVDPVEVAAWTAVARTLFNLSEFITRN